MRAIWRATWLGHCREESSIPNNATLVELMARSYTEKGVEFTVPLGQRIQAYLIESPNFPNGKGIFVITRPASNSELQKVKHPRHPKFK